MEEFDCHFKVFVIFGLQKTARLERLAAAKRLSRWTATMFWNVGAVAVAATRLCARRKNVCGCLWPCRERSA